MTISCFYANAYGGGTEQVLRHGLRVLNEIPDTNVVFADVYSRNHLLERYRSYGLRVACLGKNEGKAIISTRRGMDRIVDCIMAMPRHYALLPVIQRVIEESDVVYVHGFKEMLLALCCNLVGPTRGRPLVWHCHGVDTLPYWLIPFVNECKSVIAVSQFVANRLLQQGVSANRVHVVYNAVGLSELEQAARESVGTDLPLTPGRKTLLVACSSIRRQKGIHLCVEALAQLPDEVDLWITGDVDDLKCITYRNELQGTARRLHVEGRVKFVGLRQNVAALMRRAMFVVVPSLCHEGFSLVAAEAMALGVPVIASTRGALPDVVKHGDTGWLFDPLEPSALSRTIAGLLDKPEYVTRVASRGRDYAGRRFSYDRWALQVAERLRAVVI